LDNELLEKFRDAEAARALVSKVRAAAERAGCTRTMEVCGTHTTEFFRSGVRDALPGVAELVSGPGCPVCVTPPATIGAAKAYALSGHTVATFGDMMRVPAGGSTLEKARAEGADVRIVYSPADAVDIARREPGGRVVFIGVGFETTAPAVAASIMSAHREGLDNFAVLSAHKRIAPAMEALCRAGGAAIDGFICPGHVSVITGSGCYEKIAAEYDVPCVVTGFEPVDLLQGLLMLYRMIGEGKAAVEVQYARFVSQGGNARARSVIGEVFREADSEWRGLGTIPASGYEISDKYAAFDAVRKWPVDPDPVPADEPKGCRCADVLTGAIRPPDCGLFGGRCTPGDPVGPCMVSSEGACAAHYNYGGAM